MRYSFPRADLGRHPSLTHYGRATNQDDAAVTGNHLLKRTAKCGALGLAANEFGAFGKGLKESRLAPGQ